MRALTAIERRLRYHPQSCAMHTYSLQEKRHCSCGRDAALLELRLLRWLVRYLIWRMR